MVLLHGFAKKSLETPPNELHTARRRFRNILGVNMKNKHLAVAILTIFSKSRTCSLWRRLLKPPDRPGSRDNTPRGDHFQCEQPAQKRDRESCRIIMHWNNGTGPFLEGRAGYISFISLGSCVI